MDIGHKKKRTQNFVLNKWKDGVASAVIEEVVRGQGSR